MTLQSKLEQLTRRIRELTARHWHRTPAGRRQLARQLAAMTLRTYPIEGLRSDDPAVIDAFMDRPDLATACERLEQLRAKADAEPKPGCKK